MLKAANFEIFRETLTENNMGEQAEEFLMASGKLQVLRKEIMIKDEITIGNPIIVGLFAMDLNDITEAQRRRFEVTVSGTSFKNNWDFWIYPEVKEPGPGSVYVTEYHSNWQWWDPVTHSQAMILDDFPANLKPLIQPIDTWFENRRLALAFEAKTNGGKLIVCSIDFKDKIDEKPVSKQLMHSLIIYMNSQSFDPQIEVAISKVKGLMANSL